MPYFPLPTVLSLPILNITCATKIPLAVLILLFEKFIDNILSGAHDLLTVFQMSDRLIGVLDNAKFKSGQLICLKYKKA